MSVYFAYSPRGNIVKIGSSCRPKARVGSVSSRIGMPFTLLLVMPGGVKQERQYHSRFSSVRIGTGEYFAMYCELLEYLISYKAVVKILVDMKAARKLTSFHPDDEKLVVLGRMKDQVKARNRLPEEMTRSPSHLTVPLMMDRRDRNFN